MEILGAEHLLAARALDPKVGAQIIEVVQDMSVQLIMKVSISVERNHLVEILRADYLL